MERVTYAHEVHGTITVTAAALDETIRRYLPASAYDLRTTVEERTEVSYRDVFDVSAFLIILADFDHNTDSDPLRAY